MSRRYWDLDTDVVNTNNDIRGSTYLVGRAWVNEILCDCRKYGDSFTIRRPPVALQVKAP
ncbi:MAG TPA: hypothetical protein VFR70_00005 [Flavobacterium sp.]|nr:hypothetical protein [Flavobacterium sp.]